MKYFNNSTESNNLELTSIKTFNIDLQHIQSIRRRRRMDSYNNKTKDQYYPRVYSIPIKSDEVYILKSNRIISIKNKIAIPTNTLSSQDK